MPTATIQTKREIEVMKYLQSITNIVKDDVASEKS